ncbi:hypothetical protein [Collimonas humicola]|uniref:hypothetical protein n=1 Tax=Collimonas humicola TaxID=2825886 RepID=UPI001B8AE8CA|nr:hypothetical protein [Collimonas humicola]
MFWLKLVTSKSWGDGTALGRFLGTIGALDLSWIAITFYKVFYKNQEIHRSDVRMFFIFNGSFFALFFLAGIHSIFKEKMHKEFWSLAKQSFRIWRINK